MQSDYKDRKQYGIQGTRKTEESGVSPFSIFSIIYSDLSQYKLLLRNQDYRKLVLLPGKSHGWRSLVGCSPWGREESDTTSLSLFTFTHWRRKWQPTPVFLHGESQGWGRLVGCCLCGHTELDMTEATQQQQHALLVGMQIGHSLYGKQHGNF